MDTITVQLTAMAHGGAALGRAADKTIFVPYALPGERVEARIVEDHGRWANAELARILTPSPDRVAPPCPHFGSGDPDVRGAPDPDPTLAKGCGGCQWQHIDYAAQLRLKQAIVKDQFARVGKLPDVEVRRTIGMDEPWFYRNHVQMRLAEDGRLGFRALREHTVVPIEQCYIMAPDVRSLWQSLEMDFPELRQAILRADMGVDDRLVLLTTDFDELPELEVDFPVSINLELRDGQVVNLVGAPWLMAHIAGRDYRVSAEAFFQVNTAMAETLVRLVREALRPRADYTLLDLYAGVGLFGLALADEAGEVVAVEESPAAVADWRVNAADLDNVSLYEGRVEDILPRLNRAFDLAVLDPPRAGVERRALDALAGMQPRRIAYVSCDPATLARDARGLVERGYRIQYVQPVDMFPQTWHIECVAFFTREERQNERQARSAPPPTARGGRRRSR
ncbi:MAG: class I SAM-dependent RNA methyltransferase [Anaerolineae bacterium]